MHDDDMRSIGVVIRMLTDAAAHAEATGSETGAFGVEALRNMARTLTNWKKDRDDEARCYANLLDKTQKTVAEWHEAALRESMAAVVATNEKHDALRSVAAAYREGWMDGQQEGLSDAHGLARDTEEAASQDWLASDARRGLGQPPVAAFEGGQAHG